MFLYIHPLLKQNFGETVLYLVRLSIAADRSDDDTAAERGIVPLRCGMNEEVRGSKNVAVYIHPEN